MRGPLLGTLLLASISGAGAAPQEDGAGGGTAVVNAPTPTISFSEVGFSTSALAELWGLEEREIERYLRYNELDKHFAQPGVHTTPYEVLGKYARDDAERQRYAAMYARMAEDYQQRALEWIIAYELEMPARRSRERDLVANSRTIGDRVAEMDLYTPGFLGAPESERGAPVDAVFFVPTPCSSDCEGLFESLRSRQALGRVGRLQVVFTDLTDTKDSRQTVYRWAAAQALQPSEVGKGKPVEIAFESEREDFERLRDERTAPLAIDFTGNELP